MTIAYRYILLIGFLVVATWSGFSPTDRFTWYLEIAPIPLGLCVLFLCRGLSLSPLSWTLLFAWTVVLLVGGHYTYAEVPLFNWIRDLLGAERNCYDRFAHFVQGVVPAIVARDLLLRYSHLKSGRLLFFICSCIALSVSAFYELIEWWVSITTAYFTGEGADAFLGTQGDIWDTQWDMLMALTGSVVSQLSISRFLPHSHSPGRSHSHANPNCSETA